MKKAMRLAALVAGVVTLSTGAAAGTVTFGAPSITGDFTGAVAVTGNEWKLTFPPDPYHRLTAVGPGTQVETLHLLKSAAADPGLVISGVYWEYVAGVGYTPSLGSSFSILAVEKVWDSSGTTLLGTATGVFSPGVPTVYFGTIFLGAPAADVLLETIVELTVTGPEATINFSSFREVLYTEEAPVPEPWPLLWVAAGLCGVTLMKRVAPSQ